MDDPGVPPRAGAPTLGLILCAAAETVRAARPAMGTIVGITVVTDAPAAAAPGIEAAFAEIERWEASLSEWRPDSATSRLNRTGGPIPLAPEADALFAWCRDLRVVSDGSFDLRWRGGPDGALEPTPEGWVLRGGPVDLGGVLKGFLNDRAADVLRAAGFEDFLIDAAGDLLARGDAEGTRGWPVAVVGPGGMPVLRAVLHDEALSTSGDQEQPGHLHDARTGDAVHGPALVSVIAPTGMTADGLATAVYVGADPGIAATWGAFAVRVGPDGRREGSPGSRRRFRPVRPPVSRRSPS